MQGYGRPKPARQHYRYHRRLHPTVKPSGGGSAAASLPVTTAHRVGANRDHRHDNRATMGTPSLIAYAWIGIGHCSHISVGVFPSLANNAAPRAHQKDRQRGPTWPIPGAGVRATGRERLRLAPHGPTGAPVTPRRESVPPPPPRRVTAPFVAQGCAISQGQPIRQARRGGRM